MKGSVLLFRFFRILLSSAVAFGFGCFYQSNFSSESDANRELLQHPFFVLDEAQKILGTEIQSNSTLTGLTRPRRGNLVIEKRAWDSLPWGSPSMGFLSSSHGRSFAFEGRWKNEMNHERFCTGSMIVSKHGEFSSPDDLKEGQLYVVFTVLCL
jgi:hypothetical protein